MSLKRGSEWRKWDLHVHTPYSYLNNQFGNDFDNYVKQLFLNAILHQITVIGITDYFSIDGYKKIRNEYLNNDTKLKSLFTDEQINQIKRIKMFPNIEFRLNKIIGTNRVNFHVIFSDEVLIEDIEENFLHELEFIYEGNPQNSDEKWKLKKLNIENLGQKLITEQPELGENPLFVGLKCAVVDDTQVLDILNNKQSKFKNKYLVVVPADEDLSVINWKSQDHNVRKVILQKADMLFASNPKTIKWGLGEYNETLDDYIKEFKSVKVCIWGSDAHGYDNLFKPANNRFTWLKANPTFEGLKQVINEPKDRVFIGEIPPKLKLVQLNKDKFIENIEINKTSESKLVDKWFENTNSIPLNSGLIAIIGNKGNGKSALADIIALSGNVKLPDGDWFSFLNKKRFKDKLSLASNFESKLTWLNNTIEIVNLNDTIPEESIEKVKYLPQKYIEKICNEDEYNSFQNEINKVVFSHIKQEDRLDKNNLYDLIKIKTEVESNERENLLKDLKQILQDNEDLKVKYSDIELKKLENLLADKNQQIKDHKLNKELIVVVSDPTVDQELQGEIKTKFEESRLIINQINNLQKELVDIQSLLNTESIKKNTIEIVTGEIDILVLQFQKTMEEKQLKLKDSELEIDINSVLKIHYEKSILTRELEKVKKVISDNNELKNKKSQEINTLKENKTKLDSELSEPQKEYQDYLEKIKLWESKNIELLNEKAIIEKEINFSKTELPIKLEEHELAKAYVIDKIYSTYERELEIFKELYSPVLEFVLNEKEKLGSTSFVDFTTQIIMDKNMLIDSLISFFDGRRQQFKEEDLKELVAKYSDDIKLDNLKEMFIELLQVIERNKPLNQQFKDGKQLADFYLELLGLKYLKVEYDILFDNKNIKQLSPGERGALLIIFYLLIDKGDIPLIIDQPEDNLDNESVFEYLVPYIKQAKQRRQIIIVTHNPNIAVVADAEQVIYTELDKANGNQIKYITGAIEDKEINKQIVKVLEGTMPAFDNRTVKYYRN
jgi:ABC-type histidine transport system ATPase subunit